jgi:hypothetical protein
MPPLLCTACRSVAWEYTFPIRWTVSGVKNEPRSFSVHPTGGSLRVFGQFAWLEVGSVKAALSRPAHQRVPITAPVKC